jgi:hypothetical protein
MLDLPQAVAQVAAQGAWGVLIRALTCTQVREVVVGLGTRRARTHRTVIGMLFALRSVVAIGEPSHPSTGDSDAVLGVGQSCDVRS